MSPIQSYWDAALSKLEAQSKALAQQTLDLGDDTNVRLQMEAASSECEIITLRAELQQVKAKIEQFQADKEKKTKALKEERKTLKEDNDNTHVYRNYKTRLCGYD